MILYSINVRGVHLAGKTPPSIPKSVDHMTSAELRAVIVELRPPTVSELVECDHEVLAARHARNALLARLRQVRLRRARMDRQLCRWRSAHPFQVRLHELGLMSFRFLERWKATKGTVERVVQKLAEKADEVQEHARNVERAVEARVTMEQAPLRQYISDLEHLERQKIMQELVERWQTHEFDNALTVFKMLALKREMKAFGYDDGGVHWQALPESFRRVIDNFNCLPRGARSVALERMRSTVQLDGKDARRLMREMGLSWD